MPIDTELEKLIINKDLTKEQFEQAFADGSIGENDLSFVDDIIDGVQNKITNCITEIPQDIKLELNNGTLTLKAGSKVYVPNGFESDGTTRHFDEVVIENDMQAVIPDMDRNGAFLTYNVNGRGENMYHWSQWNPNDLYSGSTAPSQSGNKIWYDTTNNVIKEMNDGTNWTVLQTSFPFCKFSGTATAVTSIDQVFNGFGYIGSEKFMLPKVKGLASDGRNANGSLKNIEWTNSKVRLKTGGGTGLCYEIINATDWWSSYDYVESETKPSNPTTGSWWYKPSENESYRYDGSSWINYAATLSGESNPSSGVITSFQPKLPFRVVDWNDFPTITYWE